MFALQFSEYGGPEVLSLGETPEPHAGPGQIRIVVRAASVNFADWKFLSGRFAQGKPLEDTGYPGMTPLALSTRSAKASLASRSGMTCLV